MYVMAHIHDIFVPHSMGELATFGVEYYIWLKLAVTVESSINKSKSGGGQLPPDVVP